MIEILGLEKKYGKQIALSIDHLKINKHEFVGLVGNNGAGKTTMLSLILDLIAPTKGFVLSKSLKVSDTEEWKKYTGSYLNDSFLIPFLTPQEFIEFIGSLHHKNKQQVNQFLADHTSFFNPVVNSGRYIRELSAGNKNKLGILAAIMTSPEVVLLDEPFANLDPTSQDWLKTKLKELHQAGATIIISSHDLGHVTEVCGRILLLEHGLIIKDINTNDETLKELENYFKV